MKRWLYAWVAAAVALAAGTVFVPAAISAPAAAAPACVASTPSEKDALAVAAACGQQVVVGTSQSEYTQVVAQPDGRLTFESAVVPQRARRADGSWAALDLSLRAGTDRLLRPAASVADVAFSAGGDSPLVSLTRAGRKLRFSWPDRLPAPTVSGDSATYAGVLPDVDLVVRATETGFTHVLVVKNATAAANPRVRTLSLGVSGDARVERTSDGALRAVAGSTVLAAAEPAVMWDSSQPATIDAHDGSVRSSAAAAGDGARTAPVDARIATGGGLELVPDVRLLQGPDVTYPVFVDPAWSVTRSKWAYATSNGCTNTDYSVARVGLSPDGPCAGVRFRSFFEFPTTNGSVSLKGKHIESAYVQMKLDHSWSCGSTWAHMYLVPAINTTMKASWSSMRLKSWLDSAEGHANEGSGCSDSPQPDMYMNFTGSRVTSQVQTAATGNWPTVTVGFCACNENGEWESAQDRWKKFFPASAKLVVDYDSRPGRPTSLRVAGVDCPTSGVLTTGTLTPTLSAVYPDGDTGQTLTGTYEWVEVPAGGIGAVTDTSPPRLPAPPRAPATANGRATTAPVSAVKNKTYAFRVTAVDPAPYSQWSGWSAWCQFAVDTSVPPAPVITPGAIPGPGKPITFTFSSTTPDVVKFAYDWSSSPVIEVPASGTTTKTATVTLTVPRYGENILWVRAIDAVGNLGNVGSRAITVARASPPVTRWGLETYPGETQAQALQDKQPSLSFDTPLSARNVTWLDGIRLVGGQSATFNGTSSQAVTSGPAVDTSASFSVAAWVRVDSFAGCVNLSAVSADSGPSSAFRLEYDCWAGKFRMRVADKEGGVLAEAASPAAAPVRRWVHVAGVWDETDRKIKLYVDGKRVASVMPSATWLAVRGAGFIATGAVAVGRSRDLGVDGDWFRGQIADVQLFDRALVDQDLTGQLAAPENGNVDEPGILTPIEVGRWEFELARDCHVQDRADTCDAGDGTPFARWLATTRGAAIQAGRVDNGLHLDGYYFPDENPEPWGATQEWARSAAKAGLTPPDGDGYQKTVWQDRAVLRTDESYTVSAWVAPDRLAGEQTVLAQRGSHESGVWLKATASGTWTCAITDEDVSGSVTANVTSTSAVQLDVWTHLACVYDAGRNQLRLYVDGAPDGSITPSFAPMASSGPLLVGRTFWRDQLRDPWTGTLDDIAVFQGAMTDAQVSAAYDAAAGRAA
ncbi:LamG domain-containing protein [Asanoa siamensis]|uniref:LamG domain-containing protein n=1 Tax=Asanoa siamensis TaxID=926357 RepID=UPI0019447F5B|nr:LamG domain-containing protein [Asanoa siamensis]